MVNRNNKSGYERRNAYLYSEENLKKLRNIKHPGGKDHPFYGKKHSIETRKRMSLNHANVSGKKNPNYGRKYSEEDRDKMRKRTLNQIFPKSKTSIEIAMKNLLMEMNINFREQFKYKYGVADFIIPPKIIIECDGDYWHSLRNVKKLDRKQTEFLQGQGYNVLRFKGSEIKNNIQNVGGVIRGAL